MQHLVFVCLFFMGVQKGSSSWRFSIKAAEFEAVHPHYIPENVPKYEVPGIPFLVHCLIFNIWQ